MDITMEEALELPMATGPGGVLHLVKDNVSLCGKSAVTWSRAEARIADLGLAVICDDCMGAFD